MCFVYLTQCKVKKLQRRAKKTNRCSNGSTSPHLCFHRTDIHSIRSQFRHSPQKSFTFVILNAPPYPDMGRETKANYILNFFIYYMSCSFPFSTQDIAIITWKESRETTSLLLFLECRPGFVVFRYSLHRCHRASEHWQVPKQEDRQQQLWSHPREVSYLSFTHTPVHKKTHVH